jgi:hypothetical protein
MDSNPRSPSTGSSVHSGACDATHAARCCREARNARSFASTSLASDLRLAWAPSHGQSELEIGFGDFEHLAASPVRLSATFEICQDVRIVGKANAQIADESGIP